MAIVAMNGALGRPPPMFMDLRPINEHTVVVGDYEIADQLIKASKTFFYKPSEVDSGGALHWRIVSPVS
ncbi:hypothetical protein LQW54_001774 [Pestalotiopsis sp. IQ-011]